MAYANLNDDFGGSETSAMVTVDSGGRNELFRNQVFTKFCTLGFVSLGSWDMTYIVVLKGVLRVYDAEETYQNDPSGFVLEFNISRQWCTSEVSTKDYSKDKLNPIMLHCCYVLKENGMWTPTKQLKVGTPDKGTLKRLIRAISAAKC
jgi:hypothetical protein